MNSLSQAEEFFLFNQASSLLPISHDVPSTLASTQNPQKPEASAILGNWSCPPMSRTGFEEKNINKKQDGHKRKRNINGREEEKPKEVIHVRAKRGQATDSHSLAERVRREKIKEKLRYLQDMVPGCHKPMGLAGMLDVIINYVQSLQRQIDFLSMKLSVASMYYDLQLSDIDASATIQTQQHMDGMVGELGTEGYGGLSSTQNAWLL